MANERYGNNYLAVLGKEASYGTEQKTYEVILPDKVEMKKTIASIDISQKTGVLSKKNTEKLAGYTGGEVTLSGQLSPGADADSVHGILLEAMFADSSSAFEVPAVGTAPFSYTIYQYFNDNKGTLGLGCVLNSFGISGSSGGGIEYTAGFRPKSITYEDDVSDVVGGDPFSSIPDITPAIFADTTLTTMGGENNISTMNSFSIDLTNTYADDALIYQNANAKSQEILTGFEGSFTAEWNYDKANDSDISGKLMADALTSVVLAITDGTQTWTYTLYGKVTDYSFADPDKGIFTSSMTMELMSDASNIPISIAIS